MNTGSGPNIVFIMADQLAAGFVGCYGSGVDSTPTLDRLAADGVRFDRCYAHCPVCAPNRATIFTGRSIGIHGIVTNNLTLGREHPTFVEVLRRSGYATGGFGKFHLTPMQCPLPEDFSWLGFDEAAPTEDPKLGPWLDWVEREHPEHFDAALAVSWPMPYLSAYGPEKRDLTEAWAAANRRILKPRRDASDWHLQYESPLPPEVHQTRFITDCALEFMERRTAGEDNDPFFCFVSYVDPHDPYDPPAPYSTMYDPSEMPAPIPLEEPGHSSRILEGSRDFHQFRTVSGNERTMKRLRALYHGSIRFIDDQIGRITAFLEERGLAENTILVFTTDHGDMMGDHGLITKGVKHFDKGIRCPLIVRGGPVEGGRATDRLTSSLDFFPTVCDWAGIDERPPVEGRSFAAGSAAADDGWRTVTVQSPAPLKPEQEGMVRSIVTDDGWRFSVYDEDGQGEMFNLREDPEERLNLYDRSEWGDRQRLLQERHIRAYMRSLRVVQWPVLPEKEGTRYELRKGFQPLAPTAYQRS